MKREVRRKSVKEVLSQLAQIADDPDFQVSDVESVREKLELQRSAVENGKYRVVLLGPFNVGKSTFINALLGQQILPTIMEECTAKLTHIYPGAEYEVHLHTTSRIRRGDVKPVKSHLEDFSPTIEREKGLTKVRFEKTGGAQAVEHLLTALVTVNASDEYPQLKIRDKVSRIDVFVPNAPLGDEIILVDSPGVHSISEEREKVAYEVIPRSQLVLSLVDSESAGNIHDRDFIARIIELRKRKVFSVINKSDKLNDDEIDPTAKRGPAKSLKESLNGVEASPEIFFTSGYYALKARQLAAGTVSIEEIDRDNKINIPSRIWASDPSRQDVATFLLEQSRFEAFEERLRTYLFNENTEIAPLQTACEFGISTIDTMLRPIETKLRAASDLSALDELVAQQEERRSQIRRARDKAIEAINDFNTRAAGGKRPDGTEFDGWEAKLAQLLNTRTVQKEVNNEINDWLDNSENFKRARKNKFQPLLAYFETQVDRFVGSILEDLGNEVREAQEQATEQIVREFSAAELGVLGVGSPERHNFNTIDFNFGAHIAMFSTGIGAGGAAAGAVIGAAAMGWTGPGAAIGAGVGALAGAVGGAWLGAWSSSSKVKEKMQHQAKQILLDGVNVEGKDKVDSVRDCLKKELPKIRTAFVDSLQDSVDQFVQKLQEELQHLVQDADTIRENKDAIIDRLKPKKQRLEDIRSELKTLGG